MVSTMATWDDVHRLATALPQTKEALLADEGDWYFTTPHFDGFPAILTRLDRIPVPELEELLVEAWLSRAPKRLAAEYLDASG
jgi:hypothetical protein